MQPTMSHEPTPNSTSTQPARATEPARVVTPAVDVYENSDGVLVLADLPGVSQNDLTLTFENGVLGLVAERKLSNRVTFKRSFAVPDDIDPDAISAELSNGELSIRLGRRASAKPRTIAVKG